MLASGRKAKDDFIGGRDFSRVRRFDDEARRARIFAPNSGISIDVKKLEEQVKEKQEQKHLKEILRNEDENRQALEKQHWNREEEELRKQRFQDRSTLQECWLKQQEEFKQRWKHKASLELNNDKVGIMPTKRYQFQDDEVLREAEVIRRISEAWHQQIEEHNSRLRQELEDKEQNDLQLDTARKHWERTQKEIAKELHRKNVDLENEYLQQCHEKTLRDKKKHDEEHFYEIPKDYFEQFGKSSR